MMDALAAEGSELLSMLTVWLWACTSFMATLTISICCPWTIPISLYLRRKRLRAEELRNQGLRGDGPRGEGLRGGGWGPEEEFEIEEVRGGGIGAQVRRRQRHALQSLQTLGKRVHRRYAQLTGRGSEGRGSKCHGAEAESCGRAKGPEAPSDSDHSEQEHELATSDALGPEEIAPEPEEHGQPMLGTTRHRVDGGHRAVGSVVGRDRSGRAGEAGVRRRVRAGEADYADSAEGADDPESRPPGWSLRPQIGAALSRLWPRPRQRVAYQDTAPRDTYQHEEAEHLAVERQGWLTRVFNAWTAREQHRPIVRIARAVVNRVSRGGREARTSRNWSVRPQQEVQFEEDEMEPWELDERDTPSLSRASSRSSVSSDGRHSRAGQGEWSRPDSLELRQRQRSSASGSAAVLPEGWVTKISRSTGRAYYYHPATGRARCAARLRARTGWTLPTMSADQAPSADRERAGADRERGCSSAPAPAGPG